MIRKLGGALLIALCMSNASQAQTTGNDVLQKMHDAYAGKWYKTLTFTQKTTQWLPNGTERVSTWYESLRHFDGRGTLLRIDIGDLKAGNGVLFSVDSTWVMRNGGLAGVRASGNEFLPLIEGVYMQPVATTAEQLKKMGFDVSKATSGEWNGEPVWIVGTTSNTDSTSAQFWVEKKRNIVTRAILAGPQGPLQIVIGGYEPVGNGWLGTRVEMTAGGKPVQREEYSEWKVDVDLADALFHPATWTTAPHWVK